MSLKNMNKPNKLTLIRLLLLIPVFLLMIASYYTMSQGNEFGGNIAVVSLANTGYKVGFTVVNVAIVILFVIAMITDFFDGRIARKNNLVTDFGIVWDPIADKAMTNLVLIYFGVINVLPFWAVALFILRDIIVDGVRMFIAKVGGSVAAGKLGKIKTLVLSIGIVVTFLIIIWLPYTNFATQYGFMYLINLPIYVALILSIISGVMYVVSASKKMKQNSKTTVKK
ncbi:CDP-diacylglycerol--glycerol-3-phosphate 3-phosphatidyltransferase [Mycoplasmopsis verecunda]|uniref:CDP-diacylglycerol--glycerol-3-phosphate 3-phosphatidyltransferase n=1 Tax=Mycoplasmopsis verecunda TaxID=171291 RepID=A0A1T4KG15_9BACT|nr:CDP-diacylglycerol--glycerol-3-phosphate 3-phosphatidyltransferase [Mycoplasmopsis verecunda]WPB54900.1 CDP-diacylglycerol--glycerol-3-phosphate 3-phosphatidyltransferase [Mycoplasmopsis verecunda]SJZ41359.1 CDP-diacylglycerol--glycerol-3-phosphate 3-phosphatidyltransferase [Mycoplasmopsis verecunda]